jgi:hypothetical protein
MSVNKYSPHLLVLPEDDANRQLANGFDVALAKRQFQILEEAGGWRRVYESFISDHIVPMQRNPRRFMILLIDFDGNTDRLEAIKSKIPEDLLPRVFVLGTLTRPEDLRLELGSYEMIGSEVAKDCRNDSQAIWEHELLQHNKGELTRVREAVRPFLFP